MSAADEATTKPTPPRSRWPACLFFGVVACLFFDPIVLGLERGVAAYRGSRYDASARAAIARLGPSGVAELTSGARAAGGRLELVSEGYRFRVAVRGKPGQEEWLVTAAPETTGEGRYSFFASGSDETSGDVRSTAGRPPAGLDDPVPRDSARIPGTHIPPGGRRN